MADRTVCVSILSVQPGARLAQAVRRADGALLLPVGTEVDVDQLRNLIQRGIEYVYVLKEETRDAVEIARDVQAAETRVAYLFRGGGSTAHGELGAVIIDYRCREAS